MSQVRVYPTSCQLHAEGYHTACAEVTNELEDLRAAIITHRSQKADDRCIEDDDKLYEALGDGIKCDRRVGSKIEMLTNCARFIENRCQEGGWPTYAELENLIKEQEEAIEMLRERLRV